MDSVEMRINWWYSWPMSMINFTLVEHESQCHQDDWRLFEFRVLFEAFLHKAQFFAESSSKHCVLNYQVINLDIYWHRVNSKCFYTEHHNIPSHIVSHYSTISAPLLTDNSLDKITKWLLHASWLTRCMLMKDTQVTYNM